MASITQTRDADALSELDEILARPRPSRTTSPPTPMIEALSSREAVHALAERANRAHECSVAFVDGLVDRVEGVRGYRDAATPTKHLSEPRLVVRLRCRSNAVAALGVAVCVASFVALPWAMGGDPLAFPLLLVSNLVLVSVTQSACATCRLELVGGRATVRMLGSSTSCDANEVRVESRGGNGACLVLGRANALRLELAAEDPLTRDLMGVLSSYRAHVAALEGTTRVIA